ncbi:MAG: TspO/MBR family protein [Phycisphaerae bacterium]|jgi:tryptophan-rich sensory protein
MAGAKTNDIVKLIICCGAVLGVGFAGSFFVSNSSQWYQSLEKPAFTPPSYVFGPVWTVLYLLIGVSAFLVWRKGIANAAGRTAAAAFILQFIFNAAWTLIFFGIKQPLIALGDIVMLWLAIIAMIVSFRKVSTLAAVLLVPYIMWVSLAVVLNAAICILNQ